MRGQARVAYICKLSAIRSESANLSVFRLCLEFSNAVVPDPECAGSACNHRESSTVHGGSSETDTQTQGLDAFIIETGRFLLSRARALEPGLVPPWKRRHFSISFLLHHRKTACIHFPPCALTLHVRLTALHTMEADMVTANKGKRTNSLAFARTDCHTCASSGEQCDRRRPQCSMCLGRGRRCGGFAMPLSWDSRRMWTETPSAAHDTSDNACARNNVTTALEKSSDTTASIVSPAQPRRFRFVRAGSKLRKRRKTRNDGDNPSQDQPAVQPGEALAVADAEIIPREAGEDPNLGSGAQTAGEPENPGKPEHLMDRPVKAPER